MVKAAGPRILVKVKKFKAEQTYLEGGKIVMAETQTESETAWQTTGEVVDVGSTAWKNSEPWCKVGDVVHFSRYGAVRLKSRSKEDHELWILNDKDVLAIDEAKENV